MTPKLHTPLCDLLEIEYPVCLAGMGMGMSGCDLVAAVSNAGGLGLLGCSRLSPEQIRELIRRTGELTSRPFGVDILAPPLGKAGFDHRDPREEIPAEYWDFVAWVKKELNIPDTKAPAYALTEELLRQQMEVVVDENIPIFATGLGTPTWLIEEIRSHGIKYISLVGKARHAREVIRNKPDVIVAQGTESGGHTGKIGTFPLVPLIVDAVGPIPVVAAGGISDGRGLVAALALGAVGVWMGTAFLATHEAFHDSIRLGWMTKEEADFYHQTILKASEDDAIISRVKTGKTCRLFKSELLGMWEQSGLEPLPYQLQTIVMSELETALMQGGRPEYVLHVGGQVAGRIKELKGAGDLVREIVEQAVEIIRSGMPSYIL
jgi:nitronate monooxygenase